MPNRSMRCNTRPKRQLMPDIIFDHLIRRVMQRAEASKVQPPTGLVGGFHMATCL